MYDKACYERRKAGKLKKSDCPEFQAFKEIRDKWGFSDTKIKRLLTEYTKTEILFGAIDEGEFRPKELVVLDKLIAALLLAIAGMATLLVTGVSEISAANTFVTYNR